jgi:hypothetical protein
MKRAMPSPNGTNFEERYLPDAFPLLAFDAATRPNDGIDHRDRTGASVHPLGSPHADSSNNEPPPEHDATHRLSDRAWNFLREKLEPMDFIDFENLMKQAGKSDFLEPLPEVPESARPLNDPRALTAMDHSLAKAREIFFSPSRNSYVNSNGDLVKGPRPIDLSRATRELDDLIRGN